MTTPYTVVITGGSAGIGADLCQHYIEKGYTVISLARKTLSWTHERLIQIQVDLLDEAATKQAAADIAAHYDVTHFVHNAGVIWPNLIDEVKVSELQGLTQIHLGAAIQIMQAILPAMRQKQFGRVVLMSSRGALGLQTRTA